MLSGVFLVIDGPWEFENLFVVIGIAVVATGAVFGARLFAPLSRDAEVAQTAGDRAHLERIYDRFRTFGAIDTALAVLAMVAMVFKLGAWFRKP